MTSTFTYQKGGFPDGSESKESAYSAGDLVSIPESGRSPGEGNGKQLQYPCPENSMTRGAWGAAVIGATKSQTRLSKLTPSLYQRKCTDGR